MKKIVFAFILIICSSVAAIGQDTQQPRYLSICQQAENVYNAEGAEKAVKFLADNKNYFDENNALEVFFWYYLSATYAQLGNLYKQSLPLLEKCVAMIDNEGTSFYTRNNAQFLRVYYWLGVAQVYNGYDKSIATKSLEKAKLVYETAMLQDTEVYQAILNDLKYIRTSLDKELMIGIQYAFTGQNEEVISYFKEFMTKLNLDIEQHRVYHAYAVQMIGNALVNIGKTNQAQLLYIDGIKYLEFVGLTGIEPYRCICDGLSVVYNQLHNYREAYKWGMKAKAAFEKAQVYNYPYIRCLANLALSMSNMGQSVWAKILIDVVMENIDKCAGLDNNVTTLISSSNQVSSDSIRTQYDLNINQTSMVALLSNAALIYESVGCMPDAISAIKRAIEISKQHNIKAFYPLNNLAYFYLKDSQYENAEKYFKEAESYATTNYEKNEVGMNLALAQLLSSSTEATATAERYSNQINHCINNDFLLLTKEERDFYWKHYRYYLPMFNWMMLADPTKLGCIYNNVIQAKGMLLRTYKEIQDAIQASSDSTMREKYQHLQVLRSELAKATDTNVALCLHDSIESIDRELTLKLKLGKKQTTWRDIRNALEDNEVAIEFTNIPKPLKVDSIQKLTSEPRYCAMILKKSYDKPHLIGLCTEAQFDAIPDTLYYTSTKLYQLFWAPLAREIGEASVVYYSPDRYMSSVAFENILSNEGKSISYDKQIVRVSSTSEIVLDKTQKKGSDYVLIGGINYAMEKNDYVAQNTQIRRIRSYGSNNTRGSLDDISIATFDEVNNISAMLKEKGIKATLLTKSQANETSFKALSGKDIGVLHIATHGFYWSDENEEESSIQDHIRQASVPIMEQTGVLRSGLLLAGSKLSLDNEKLPEGIDDGILTGAEIENMDLSSVDLVVLSACQTGLGQVEPIEGVYGLQRAFKKAGVKSILMTLWKVDDEATQLFMTEFYRDYLKNNSKQHALKAAQEYLKNYRSEGEHVYSDPYYWAGFVLLDALN